MELYPVLERIAEVVRGGEARITEDVFLRNCCVSRRKRDVVYSRCRAQFFFGSIFNTGITEYEEFQKCAKNNDHRELSKLDVNVCVQ